MSTVLLIEPFLKSVSACAAAALGWLPTRLCSLCQAGPCRPQIQEGEILSSLSRSSLSIGKPDQHHVRTFARTFDETMCTGLHMYTSLWLNLVSEICSLMNEKQGFFTGCDVQGIVVAHRQFACLYGACNNTGCGPSDSSFSASLQRCHRALNTLTDPSFFLPCSVCCVRAKGRKCGK
jgi:hypothetical protein